MARCVWALEGPDLVELLENNTEPDAKRWIFGLIDGLPHGDFTKVLVTLWAIRHACRKATHEQVFQLPPPLDASLY